MLRLDTYFNENRTASQSGAVVLLKTEASEFKGKKVIASALIAVSLSVLSLQAGFVLNANAEDNPITSPVSAPEVTPTPAPTSQPSNNGGGNSSGGSSNSGGSAPSCNNEAPKAPKIVSATSAGKNEITLNWEKAQGPVTHYAISYGLMKGKPLYGIANIGNVTSYTVKGLSAGVTYYFQLNAVNGCTAGPASNEIGIKGGGKIINTPPVGFKPAVKGKAAQTTPVKNIAKNMVVVKNESPKAVTFHFETGNTLNPGIAGKVISFFKGLFN